MNHIIHLKDNKDKTKAAKGRKSNNNENTQSWSCTVLIEYGKNYEERFRIHSLCLCVCSFFLHQFNGCARLGPGRVRVDAISFRCIFRVQCASSQCLYELFSFVHKLFTFYPRTIIIKTKWKSDEVVLHPNCSTSFTSSSNLLFFTQCLYTVWFPHVVVEILSVFCLDVCSHHSGLLKAISFWLRHRPLPTTTFVCVFFIFLWFDFSMLLSKQ